MRRLLRLLGFGAAAFILSLVLLAVVTARSGNPALWPPQPDAPTTGIFVVSHGYHAGLVFPTAKLADAAQRNGDAMVARIAEQFGSYPFIEIGWGEQEFYASVPTTAQLSFGMAARALLRPGNRSVLHVVGLPDHPRKVFPLADMVPVMLDEEGLARILKAIDATFTRDGEPPAPQPLGKRLYGASLFFRANGTFHIFNVCNHWVADMLSTAGLPVTPVLDTVPPGLLFDLKWRAGLDRMPGVTP
jgi:uncharacterized protein (TIGR02117 family)